MASTFPARPGTPQQCRTLTEFLAASRFTEPALLEAFAIPDLNTLLMAAPEDRQRLRQRIEEGGVQMLLAKLFLGGYTVKWPEAARVIPPAIFQILKELGLYDESGRCPLLFYPAKGFYLASDRPSSSDGYGYGGSDFVMSALEYLSHTYVTSIGNSRCDRFLEVGAGAGLGALCATRFAGEVWATDITPRSIACIEFNRQLNGIPEEKLHVLCGDMFAPVEGLTFDRIACNPPFEPPLRHDLIYSVGGVDGEQLIERVVRGAVPMLRPNGRLYCQVLGTDRRSESFFQRILRWLQGTNTGVAFFMRARLSTDGYTVGQLMNSSADASTIAQWDRFYQKLDATHVVTGHLTVERDASYRICEQLGPQPDIAPMERRITWEQGHRSQDWQERILNSSWMSSNQAAIEVLRTLREGAFVPVDHLLVSTEPFHRQCSVPPSTFEILAKAATPATGHDIVVAAQSHEGIDREELLEQIALCIALGALEERPA